MAEPDFWTLEMARYLRSHRHPWNRRLHFVGIPILVATPILALVLHSWWLLLSGQVIGWVIQLLGHRIEGNRPALLAHPIAFLIGPLMVLTELLSVVGLRPAFANRARTLVEADPRR